MMNRIAREIGWTAVLLALACGPGLAQEPRRGPVKPPPEREVKRIPINPEAEPPPIPPEEIIRRFSEKEDELARALDRWAYRVRIRVQEYDSDGDPAGDIQMTSDLYVKDDGKRYGRPVDRVPPSLKLVDITEGDLQELVSIPPFTLPGKQLDNYELTYQGKQAVDELTAYVFAVRPKRLDRRAWYFEGAIWVDDRDLEIVKTYGKYVTEVGDVSPLGAFKLYETYREVVNGNLRFPTYTSSEDVMSGPAGPVRVRMTIRITDLKPAGEAGGSPPGSPSR